MNERRFHALITRRRGLAILCVLAATAGLAALAARVRPDYSIEMGFPTFDPSRTDFERYKRDFPTEGARALVVVEAPDLYTPAGLARVRALEDALGALPGVLYTQGLGTVRDLRAAGDAIRIERLVPATELGPEALERVRATATSDPLFAWRLASPDGRAATIEVLLTAESAATDAARTRFLHDAREVLSRHAALAEAEGASQRLTLSGLPVVRSLFTELINRDLARLFPICFLLITGLLLVTLRQVSHVLAAVVTIVAAVIWTGGALGALGIPLQVLTQVTPIIVLIISISDTAHILSQARAAMRSGTPREEAIARACADGAMPCLLTELTIAGGLLGLAANDILMIQQFGLASAVGVLLAWAANVTVLPLALSFCPPPRSGSAEAGGTWAERGLARLVASIERAVASHPRGVLAAAGVIAVLALAAGLRAGREYYVYDDLRPDSGIARDLRYLESVQGGSVPLVVYVEPLERRPDAMLEPEAVALLDRITRRLEGEHPDDVKSAASLSKYLRKAHRLLAGDAIADEEPLPTTRPLVAQELVLLDDPRVLRDFLSFERDAAAVLVSMPDQGSSHATAFIAGFGSWVEEETRGTPYRVTLTGAFGISDGVYRALVGGLLRSLAIALLVSFASFFLVLRSWGLALVALVPNVLPLFATLGAMAVLGIDIKPSTVIVFSVTLVIADDDTIQYLTRFRSRCRRLLEEGVADAHRRAARETLGECGVPMLLTTLSISLGFGVLALSEFSGLANFGVLVGVSLLTALLADLFLSPLLVTLLRPRV